jgi:hypothetical protein
MQLVTARSLHKRVDNTRTEKRIQPGESLLFFISPSLPTISSVAQHLAFFLRGNDNNNSLTGS